MPIKVTCPKCQGVLHAPDDAGGKRGKCPTCGTVLAIPAEGTAAESFRAQESPVESPATHRSSFGAIPRPADVEPARPAAGRLPAPPAFAVSEPKKLDDPFARPGRPVVPGVAGEGLVRSWRRARRGLGCVLFSLVLFLLAGLGFVGMLIAEHYGVKLPDQNPGYLKIENLDAATEIKLAVLVIPSALGLLLYVCGLFGFSNVPRSSFAKGLATCAAVAALVMLLGSVAVAVPAVGQLAEGFVPHDFLPADNANGIAQRAGLALAVVFGTLADLWFVFALSRMGAALHNVRLGSRATRFVVLIGGAIGIALLGLYAYDYAGRHFPRELSDFVATNVQPQWDKLGNNKPVVLWGAAGLAGLVVWLMYARLVTAGRRAIREWLETNEPAV